MSVGICLMGNAAEQQTNRLAEPAGMTANKGGVTNRPVSHLFDDPDFQHMIDSWAKGAETNGLLAAVFTHRPTGSKDLLPIVYVNVINTTTNLAFGFLNLPREVLFKIAMFDPQGKATKRTAAGEKFRRNWTQKQIEDWHREQVRIRSRGRGIGVSPLSYAQVNGGLSLPELFQFEQPGEYTFHLRMPLIKVLENEQGTIYYKTTWLPEVVAKVQVRPEDIAAAKSSLNTQTNAASK